MTNGGGLLLPEITSAQVRATVAEGRGLWSVPFGALKHHVPHLPLDTDPILGDQLGALLALRLVFCALAPFAPTSFNGRFLASADRHNL
jgi:creatinine amidohydrolase/Fe(II)-dependent formamide hydrolase-like protein